MSNIISFEQNYYTSCRKGLGTGSGWQTKAQSKGIDIETQKVLEKYVGTYNIPMGNDPRDAANQPLSFKSFSPGHDLWCVSLTQYEEKNWQGRYGSFFAHSLICSKSDFERFDANPFRILRAGCFIKEDPPERTQLDVLPIVPVPRTLKEIFDEFRREFPEQTHISDLLNAILFARILKRPIIIVLPSEKLLNLMEGIICLLPLSLRLSFSFSTYELDPYPLKDQNPNIANRLGFFACKGTVPPSKSRFRFTDIEYQHEYFIFNFADNRFSEIPGKAAYTDWVCQKLFAGKYEDIESCHQSLAIYQFTEENIDSALCITQLKDVITNGDSARINQALEFARLHSNQPLQVEKSIETLLAGDSDRTKYGIQIITTALEIACKHPDEGLLQNVYSKYIKRFRDTVGNSQHTEATSLMEAAKNLPAHLRKVLPIDLKLDKGHVRYFVPLIKTSFDLLRQYPDEEIEQSLYDEYLDCMNDSLNKEDQELANALLTTAQMLPTRKKLLLPTDISSTRGYMKYQVPLVEQALDLLRSLPSDPLIEQVYQKYVNIFNHMLQQKKLTDMISLVNRIHPKLPETKQRNFYLHLFKNRLHELLACLVEPSEEEANFLEFWLPGALEDEFLFILDLKFQRDLDRMNIQEELRLELQNHGIQSPSISIEKKRDKKIGTIEWNISDRDQNVYIIRSEDNQLKVYRYDPHTYERRLKETIQFIIEHSLEKHYLTTLMDILKEQIEIGRIGSDSKKLLIILFDFVEGASSVKQRISIFVQDFLPLVKASDNKNIIKHFIIGLATGFEEGMIDDQLYKNEIEQFFYANPFVLDIIRELYPDKAEKTLGRWYCMLLEQKKYPKKEELRGLYAKENYDLFLLLLERHVKKSNQDIDTFLISLLPQLEPFQSGFYQNYFQRILDIMSRESNNRLPNKEFIEKISGFFETHKIDFPIVMLGKHCVKIMDINSQLSDEENAVIDKWLNSNPTDRTLEAKIKVFRELRKLPENTQMPPKHLLKSHLSRFQTRKHELRSNDFRAAAKRILYFLSKLTLPWKTENWNVIEEVSRDVRNEPPYPDPGLLRYFLENAKDTLYYLDIFTGATLSWLQDKEKYLYYRRLLDDSYKDLKKKKKIEYEKKVLDFIAQRHEENKYPLLKEWKELIKRKEKWFNF
jgi:hypothetical protein